MIPQNKNGLQIRSRRKVLKLNLPQELTRNQFFFNPNFLPKIHFSDRMKTIKKQ